MELFPVGAVEITPGAAAALAAAGSESSTYLARHQRGDWGDVDEKDREDNTFALRYGHPIASSYRLADGGELLVMTAADRSSTRILLASEYEDREVSTREGYAIWSTSYDTEKNPLIAVEEPRVDTLLAPLSFGRVLDVGTGTGRHALKLARRGAHVTAIDQSPEMLAVARQSAEREGLTIDFRLLTFDDGLPFASGQFDLLICALVLSHGVNLQQTLQEFARVLAPGGYLLITDYHPHVIGLGWRNVFLRPGVSYLLPSMRATRADYLEAAVTNGFDLLQVLDVPVSEVPEGYFDDAMRRDHGDKPFCLIILAQKPAADGLNTPAHD